MNQLPFRLKILLRISKRPLILLYESSSSIRVQMAIAISLFSLIIVLTLFALIFTITHTQLKQQKAQSIEQEMQGLSQVIQRQLKEYNYVAVDDLVKMSLNSPNITEIYVRNEFNQDISNHSKKNQRDSSEFFQRILYINQSNTEKIGEIDIWWIMPDKLFDIDTVYQKVLLFVLVFMAILSTLIYHYLAFSIAKPLNHLEEKLLEFKPGQTFKKSRYIPREILSLQRHYLRMANNVQKQMESLEILARTDSLTQLANRANIEEVIQKKIERGLKSQISFAIFFLDLDHFKKINDVYGHNTGDQVLIGLTNTLQHCISAKDTLGRFGGDEFILIIDDKNSIGSIIRGIYEKLDNEFIFGGQRIFLSISIGVAIWPNDGKTRELLLRNADIALYQSKQHGRNQANYFSRNMEKAANNWLHAIDTVRAAIQKNNFTCYWQPIINQHQQLEWYELLIRLIKDDGTLLEPALFLPIAEENGLMKKIASFTCEFAYDLLINDSTQSIIISINFSLSQLMLPSLDKILIPLLPWKQQVIIEVTEEAFLGDRQTQEVLIKLRKRGFKIALDDFGSGFSSLAILLDLPIDIVKLDKEFQKNIQQRDDARAMLQSIIAMLHTLGKKVVAEGIQNKTQYEFAVTSNCHYLQGNYFHRPTPVTINYAPPNNKVISMVKEI